MDTVTELRGNRYVRSSDPETSHLAAEKILGKAASIRRKVYNLFIEFGPMTDYWLVQRFYLRYGKRPYSSVQKRRGDLRDAGIIRDSGRREVIPTGSTVIVWELVP